MPTVVFEAFWWVGTVLTAVYCALICYYHWLLKKLPLFRVADGFQPLEKITVLIPARNEEENIGACVQSILSNDYPAALLEIIVINDHSTDGTAAVVKEIIASLKEQRDLGEPWLDRLTMTPPPGHPEPVEGPGSHPEPVEGPFLRLLNLADYTGGKPLNSYKKKAIELAVGKSTGSLIVTTDADCMVPRQWLRQLSACRQQNDAVLVAAPVSFRNNGRFSGLFQCLDFMSLQGITAASVAAGFHTMCNGANLLYEKAAFYRVNGFAGIDNIASGDDMLLMQKLTTAFPGRIAFCYTPEAIVVTEPMPDWASFFNQRIRWASKSTHYKDKKMLGVLVLVYFFNVYLLLTPLVCFFVPALLLPWSLMLAAKTLAEWAFMYTVSGFLGGRRWLVWFALMQPFHIVYTVVAGWLGKFGSYRWKERKVQ